MSIEDVAMEMHCDKSLTLLLFSKRAAKLLRLHDIGAFFQLRARARFRPVLLLTNMFARLLHSVICDHPWSQSDVVERAAREALAWGRLLDSLVR